MIRHAIIKNYDCIIGLFTKQIDFITASSGISIYQVIDDNHQKLLNSFLLDTTFKPLVMAFYESVEGSIILTQSKSDYIRLWDINGKELGIIEDSKNHIVEQIEVHEINNKVFVIYTTNSCYIYTYLMNNVKSITNYQNFTSKSTAKSICNHFLLEQNIEKGECTLITSWRDGKILLFNFNQFINPVLEYKPRLIKTCGINKIIRWNADHLILSCSDKSLHFFNLKASKLVTKIQGMHKVITDFHKINKANGIPELINNSEGKIKLYTNINFK